MAFREEAGASKDVEITEVDIDNFIRAKGAIFSAICTMLNSLEFDVSMIDKVYVACCFLPHTDASLFPGVC